MRKYKSFLWSALPICLLILALLVFSTPQSALAFQATTESMPTAGEDGRILYTIQAGDTQIGIASRFGIELLTLQALNNWTGDTVLAVGQTALLGLASEQVPTATAIPTSPENEVVATIPPQTPGTGSICVLLFNDENGDAMRQETEFGIADGQASANERTGLASQSDATQASVDDAGDPVRTCFEDLPLGEYTVSVALPDGYNPTTARDTTIQLAAGQTQNINFGAQQSTSGGFNVLTPEEGGRSPLIGLLGIVLILAGAGLGFYTFQSSRRR